ncbi:MAG: hypothetical protein ABSA93_36960 [Streptosporangiaceae bacterium]
MKSRLVGVTAGLGTPSRLSWTGSRNTAPDTPTGAVITAISNPARQPISVACQITGAVSRSPLQHAHDGLRRPGTPGTGREAAGTNP